MASSPFAKNLLPCVHQWYKRSSAQGAPQGCPMGISLFCLGFHASLLQTQHAYPDVRTTAFADNDDAVGSAARAMAARACTRSSAQTLCNLESVPSKFSLYSPAANLSSLPPDASGSTFHPEGRRKGIVVVGTPIGSPEFVASHLSHSGAQLRSCLSSLTALTDTHRDKNAA
eukprot:6214373-Pleurochrysis_carterae.AAC.7